MSNLTVINQSLSSSFDTLGAGGLLQGNNNLIINGDFEIAQRGTSFPTTNGYTLDRFIVSDTTDGAITVTQDTDVPTYEQSGHNSKHSLKIQVTSADSSIGSTQYADFLQPIEGYLFYPMVGKNITVSFWVKSKITGVFCGVLTNSSNRSYVKEFVINSVDTWEKKTLTIPMNYSGGTWNYTNGVGIYFAIFLACGTTFQTTANAWQNGNYLATSSQVNFMSSTANYINFAQMKMEIGSTATPFTARNYIDELRLCQRYCYVIRQSGANILFIGNGSAGATTTARIGHATPTTMRIIPSIESTSSTIADFVLSDLVTTTSSSSAPTLNTYSSNNYLVLNLTVASGLMQYRPYFLYFNGSSSAYIIFTAEL